MQVVSFPMGELLLEAFHSLIQPDLKRNARMSSPPRYVTLRHGFGPVCRARLPRPAASKSTLARGGRPKGSDESKEPVTSLVNHRPDLLMIGVRSHVHVPPPRPHTPVYPFSGLQNGPGA